MRSRQHLEAIIDQENTRLILDRGFRDCGDHKGLRHRNVDHIAIRPPAFRHQHRKSIRPQLVCISIMPGRSLKIDLSLRQIAQVVMDGPKVRDRLYPDGKSRLLRHAWPHQSPGDEPRPAKRNHQRDDADKAGHTQIDTETNSRVPQVKVQSRKGKG